MRVGRFLHLSAAVAAAVLLGAGPAPAASTRAVGGTDVGNPGWVVQIEAAYPSGSGAFCGGELISKAWILTAAHCVTDESNGQTVGPGAVRTWVGLNRRSDASATNAQAVDRVVVDPSYSAATSFGDLALLHLTAPDAHTPVALGGAAEPFVGSTATVLGWGVTVPLLNISSDTLQQVGAPILDTSTCTPYGAMYDAGTMICAGGLVGRDSCNGDSGGPLAYAPLGAASLVGTVDYGSELCGDGSPSVYQRVTSGPASQWLAATVPTAAIEATTGPPKNSTITATASATNLPNATFAWDLDGNGEYGDASGPSVAVNLGAGPQSVGVRATGADGEQAARRVTIVPRDTTVAASVPARATEGRPLTVGLTTTGPGEGTVTARASGRGISSTATATVPGSRSLQLTVPDDRVWSAPRKVTVALSTGGGVALVAPTSATTTIVDDDRPVVRITSVRRPTAGSLSIAARPPGSGTFTVRLVRGGRTVARRAVRVRGTRSTRLRLALGTSARRAIARGGARVRISWRSSSSPAATASAQRAVR